MQTSNTESTPVAGPTSATAADVLKFARARLAIGWGKRWLMSDKNGNPFDDLGLVVEHAAHHSISGALLIADFALQPSSVARAAAQTLLAQEAELDKSRGPILAKFWSAECHRELSMIWSFESPQARTQAEVLALFDKTIAVCEAHL